jgi:hypothetical protein
MFSAAQIASDGEASPPGPLGRKHAALARRIVNRQDDYLRFGEDPRVPFDNYAGVLPLPWFGASGLARAGPAACSAA